MILARHTFDPNFLTLRGADVTSRDETPNTPISRGLTTVRTPMMATYRHYLLIALLTATITAGTGCATSAQTQQEEKERAYNELQARLMESERLNKRLDRKIGHLEQALAATQDKIEAQTLAARYEQHQPDPVPESRFSNGFTQERRYARNTRVNASIPQRQERRIRLSPNHYVPPGASGVEFYADSEPVPEDASPEVVIITQEDLDAFGRGANRARRASQNRDVTSNRSGRRIPQPDVTDERLPVTGKKLDRTPSANPVKKQVAAAEPPAAVSAPVVLPPSVKERAKVAGMAFPPQPSTRNASLEVYEDGLNFYRSGDFRSSLDRFSQFLQSEPEPSYLDNALYWIGESYYGLNNMPKSIQYFKRVIAEVPTGNKVPNAMLKMAIAYRNLGQEKKSQRVLREVVEKFPSSGAGQIAKRELEK